MGPNLQSQLSLNNWFVSSFLLILLLILHSMILLIVFFFFCVILVSISTLAQEKEKEECLSVQEIIRVSVQLTCALIYFITIKASDGNFYEAKVLLSPSGEQSGSCQQFSTVFIRTAQHYPVTDPEVLQLKMSEAEAGSSAGPSASGSGC